MERGSLLLLKSMIRNLNEILEYDEDLSKSDCRQIEDIREDIEKLIE